jgi:hypothetical protein
MLSACTSGVFCSPGPTGCTLLRCGLVLSGKLSVAVSLSRAGAQEQDYGLAAALHPSAGQSWERRGGGGSRSISRCARPLPGIRTLANWWCCKATVVTRFADPKMVVRSHQGQALVHRSPARTRICSDEGVPTAEHPRLCSIKGCGARPNGPAKLA